MKRSLDYIKGNYERKELVFLFTIVLVNLLIKSIPAGLVELGNDEVYYWTYALFPDWSHFDHPPMVGIMIQLFSLNLKFSDEFFLRAGPLFLSSASLIVLYFLVKKLYPIRAAFIAVLLFLSSFYFNLISGFLVMADSPQVFFILLSLFFLIPAVTKKEPSPRDNFRMIMFGIFTGLAFLSKYHSLFLWLGAGLYILFHNRAWLKKPSLYLSMALTLVLMIPVIYWNAQNNFISFTFHGERVGFFEKINPVSFLQFNAGQIFYQNPVISVIYAVAFFAQFKNIKDGIRQEKILLLYLFIPLVVIFTFISLFRTTLPHWTGPAFICILILSSEYLDHLYDKGKKKVKSIIGASLALFCVVLIAGTLQIRLGFIRMNSGSESSTRLGKDDISLDMYGWSQLRGKLTDLLEWDRISLNDQKNIVILSDGWFPAAHLDYYIAKPLNIRLLAIGDIGRIHKYYWIDRYRGLKSSDRVFYITDSRNFGDPEKFREYFSGISARDSIAITRNNRTVKYAFIYELTGIKSGSFPASVFHDL